MSQKIVLLTLPVVAAAALTDKRFVTATGAVATAAGNALGVTTSDAAIGDQVGVDVIGTTTVTAGGAIAKNAQVEVGTSGKAVTKASGTVVARALEAATADGDVIEVLLLPN